MLVLDASAVAELVLARPSGLAVADQLAAHEFDVHAPHVLDVEVMSAVRRLVASGHATRGRAEQAIEDLLALPVERYAHEALVRRAWEYRENFSPYDATYLALAEALADQPVPLLTADARFARAIEAHAAVPVVLVP
ncbi:MAG TPA: type II toxin-antitoxin system VapC family toxin [Solirubrobacter sp.]|nr:type II toxin-antitoxin system VapC family toxin [Solirubrobacter sp.]